MITKDIARLVYNCYSEIENSEKMIETMKEAINEKGELIATFSPKTNPMSEEILKYLN